MPKFTIMELILLAITIFGATNMMALQGALAQNNYYFTNDQTYPVHYIASTNHGGEYDNDNMYSYNNYYYPQSPSTPSSPSSNYPTEDKKYECQKGQFEGFFVSSPKFCATSSLLKLMTWNIYLGADLSPIFVATTPQEFVAAVGSAYNKIQASNFVERANSIANEAKQTRSDLIGLQEVSLLRTQSPSDGHLTPATNVSLDYLQILIDALNVRGLKYEPIVVQTAFDSEVPGLINGSLVDLRLTDREVILARVDIKDFTLSNTQGAQFAANFTLTTPLGSISIPRAWVSVDVTFDKGDKARIISTHLEPLLHPQLSPIIQGLQADELLNGPGNTNLPVVFIGDFNSKADGTGTPTYSKIIDAGFIDAWNIRGKGNGFTCCQAENLLNQVSSLDQRIDLVLFRGDFKVKGIELVGNSQNDRTLSGLWPSDHAGVVATLKLNN
jgi:endonuclease/exonuclease/phosphatase family metal-dependent hydrolase